MCSCVGFPMLADIIGLFLTFVTKCFKKAKKRFKKPLKRPENSTVVTGTASNSARNSRAHSDQSVSSTAAEVVRAS